MKKINALKRHLQHTNLPLIFLSLYLLQITIKRVLSNEKKVNNLFFWQVLAAVEDDEESQKDQIQLKQMKQKPDEYKLKVHENEYDRT